jgi:hypothetical protein
VRVQATLDSEHDCYNSFGPKEIRCRFLDKGRERLDPTRIYRERDLEREKRWFLEREETTPW